MKLRTKIFLTIFGFAVLVAGAYVYQQTYEANTPGGGSLVKKVIRDGSPAVSWFRTEKAFHFLLVFDDGFVAHGRDIMLGAHKHAETIKIECSPRGELCVNARLISLTPIKKGAHVH